MNDSSTYWATIAQVVPVIFIGVMIEFRWLLARTAASEDKFVSSAFVRWLGSLWLAMVCISLAFSFYFALLGLRQGLPSDGLTADIALAALGSGATFSMLGPGVLLAYSAAPDMWTVMWRSFPWSSVARLRRKNNDLERRLQRMLWVERGKLLEVRMMLAAAYVQLSKADLAARRLPGSPPSDAASMIEARQRELDEWRAEIDEVAQSRPTTPATSNAKLITLGELERFREQLAELAARKD